MNERIDHGAIIATNNFLIWPGDTVESLKYSAAIHSLALLHETLDDIRHGKPLAPCGAKWERHLYTSKELELAQSIYTANINHSALGALRAAAANGERVA